MSIQALAINTGQQNDKPQLHPQLNPFQHVNDEQVMPLDSVPMTIAEIQYL